MKRYLLFAFEDYYPSGGLSDVWREFDTVEEFEQYKSSDEFKEWQREYMYLFDCQYRVNVWMKE